MCTQVFRETSVHDNVADIVFCWLIDPLDHAHLDYLFQDETLRLDTLEDCVSMSIQFLKGQVTEDVLASQKEVDLHFTPTLYNKSPGLSCNCDQVS